jgi:hypothetical protein
MPGKPIHQLVTMDSLLGVMWYGYEKSEPAIEARVEQFTRYRDGPQHLRVSIRSDDLQGKNQILPNI